MVKFFVILIVALAVFLTACTPQTFSDLAQGAVESAVREVVRDEVNRQVRERFDNFCRLVTRNAVTVLKCSDRLVTVGG